MSESAKTFDKIKAIAMVTIAVLLVALFAAFVWVCWLVLAQQSRAFVQTWAIVVSILLPVGMLATGALGLWFGLKQADFVLTGAQAAAESIFGIAQKVADVKVQTYGRYKRLTVEQPADPTMFGPMGLPSASSKTAMLEE